MRNYGEETEKRVEWIRQILADSGAKGIIFGASGGKDSVLAGILCKKATDNLLGVIMPCGSRQNYGRDREDAELAARRYGITTVVADLSEVKERMTASVAEVCELTPLSANNINPRLRMTALYAIGQSLGYLVAGTGNLSESYMGYFTKWGDGAHDFNPIADLTVTEIYEFLRYLDAPSEILDKAPSAGLYDGQTDESELGVSYAAIDRYIADGGGTPEDIEKITRAHGATAHKRRPTAAYGVTGSFL